jgi:transcriptional regulator with XRE-family HTH domain
VSSALDGRAALAEELRRRRTALGWTLEQVAAQAQVSVGMLSLIETGKRRPSMSSWERIRGALGISEPLPEEAWRSQPREISDELVATLGACLAAVRQATLAELAAATGVSISDVRLGLRRLAQQLEPAGMQVLDDGSHVQLAPERRFHDAVAQLAQRSAYPGSLRSRPRSWPSWSWMAWPPGVESRRSGGGDALHRGGGGGLAASRQLGDARPVALAGATVRRAGRSCDRPPAGLRADPAAAPAAGG